MRKKLALALALAALLGAAMLAACGTSGSPGSAPEKEEARTEAGTETEVKADTEETASAATAEAAAQIAEAQIAEAQIEEAAPASDTEETAKTQEQTQNEITTPDADWDLPETIEMSEKVKEVFDKAVEGMTGVSYEPVGYLGEKDGVYCVLSRAAEAYPDTKPYYALVYVSDEGVENIWDIWMGAHAKKK